MNITWSRRRTLIAGIALIAISNAVALGGVSWNRSGEPDSVLNLTQRELFRKYSWLLDREESGVTLSLHWRVLTAPPDNYYYMAGNYGAPEWLDQAKLISLGFDVSKPLRAGDAERKNKRLLPRDAFVVLEFDGPTRQKALERASERVKFEAARESRKSAPRHSTSGEPTAATWLKKEETVNSRLFAVDAGLDAAALREKYPDRARYAIVRGIIRAQAASIRSGGPEWSGSIEQLLNAEASVPLELRPSLGNVPRGSRWGEDTVGGPEYEVTVAFGQRYEPWILAAKAAAK